MNKPKIAIIAAVLTGLGVAVVGFLYGYFGSRQIEKALSQEMQFGVVAFVPGTIDTTTGFFTSRADVTNSYLAVGSDRIEIPEMQVFLRANKLWGLAKTAQGTWKAEEAFDVNLQGIRLEVDATPLLTGSSDFDGLLTVEETKIEHPEATLDLEKLWIELTKQNHFHWDEIQIALKQIRLDFNKSGQALTVELDNLLAKQQHEIRPNQRLGVPLTLNWEKLVFSIVTLSETIRGEVLTTSNELDLEITGDAQTLFWATLSELLQEPQSQLEQYWATYQPKWGDMKFAFSQLNVGSEEGLLSVGKFEGGQQLTPKEDLEEVAMTGTLEEIKLQAQEDFFLAERISINGTTLHDPQAYAKANQFNLDLESMLSPKYLETLLDYLMNLNSQGQIELQEMTLQAGKNAQPVKVQKLQLGSEAQTQEGVLSINLNADLDIRDFGDLDKQSPVALPIQELAQEFRLEFSQWNLNALRPLFGLLETEDILSNMNTINQALRDVVAAQPGMSVTWEGKTNQDIQVKLGTAARLTRPLPDNFGIEQLIFSFDGTPIQQKIKQLLVPLAEIDVDVAIDEYEALSDLVDKAAPGVGKAVLLQTRPFFEFTDKNMAAKLEIHHGEILLNGQPNPTLEVLIKNFLLR